jgi:hypothetical protein
MSVVLNGQSWRTTESIGPPIAQVDENLTYSTPRNTVFIQGGSDTNLTALGIKGCMITLNFSYLPKIGRHNLNSGYTGPIGGPNTKLNYLTANMQYERLDGTTLRGFATSGFVDITQVSNTQVAGSFEFEAFEFNVSNPSAPPLIFKAEKGQFNAKIIDFTPLPVIWDGTQ